MQAAVITLFPEYFAGPFDCGPTRIACADGKLEPETRSEIKVKPLAKT